MLKSLKVVAAGVAVACLAFSGVARAEVSEVRITRQPGLSYIPMIIVEQQKLIEKHAASEGIPALKPQFITLSGGGAANEALLSRNVDLVMTSPSNMLLLNDRTKGTVKGFFGIGGSPMLLLSRNPNVKTIADFGPGDRIAVPTLKTSTQAILLQMASEKATGDAHKLDSITIQLGHPDAYASLTNSMSEVNSHFSLSPYQEGALKNPAVHEVLSSNDIVPQQFNNSIIYGYDQFATHNPKVIEAVKGALQDAYDLIQNQPDEAAKIWLEATKEKMTVDEVKSALKAPGSFFSLTPYGTELIAGHFYKMGVLRAKPRNWKEYFIASSHDMKGN